MSPIEAVAAVLILINVLLVARRSIWNYAFAIGGVLLYGWIFYTAKLYSDALLQIFFLIVNLYGWRHWTRLIAVEGEVLAARLSNGARARWIGGIALTTVAWGWLMHRFTDAALPWPDAFVAMTSIAAQILLSRQKIENWILWIVVDLVGIAIYAVRGLWPTVILYILLLAISLWGLADWHRSERRVERPAKRRTI